MKNTLILDGQQRSALAATRSLGKRGVPVYVAEAKRPCLAGRSRFCRESIQLPSAEHAPEVFIEALREVIAHHRIKVLLPMTDITTATVLRFRQQLGDVALPCPTFDHYDAVTNKNTLFKTAQTMGIPMPRTLFIEQREQLTPLLAQLTYPIVIKPAYSRIFANNQWLNTAVSFADSEQALLSRIENTAWLREHPFMLQAYIEGEGQGLFALFDNGKPLVYFSHRRLREKPPSGGVSVLCESTAVNEQMRSIAAKILADAQWHGVAMVEFKVSPEGTPYLMEVNGRFWGSLQLAIDAGVDFPYLAYQLATHATDAPVGDYRTGIRNRWLLGDLDRLYLVLKDRTGRYSRRAKWQEIVTFLNFFEKNTRFEVNRFGDMGPFYYELRQYLTDLVK